MSNKKVGRPKSPPPRERQITAEQALQLIEEHRKRFGRPGVTRGHLYNMISDEKLHRWGPARMAILDKDEVIEVFGLVG